MANPTSATLVKRDNTAMDETRASDETTPLLVASAAAPTAQANEEPLMHETAASNDGSDDDKPLPKAQVFLLCYLRLVETIAFFAVFPFINKMIWEIGGLKEEDVGFYSGLIESLFSVTQMLIMISWGRAADRFGRKPVMVLSLIGITIATSMFGLSKRIWQMIVFRCLAGLFAGNVVTIRAMLAENCTPKTQARAFSFFAFTGNLGIFVAPLIGGILSEPAKQYPSLFGNVQFFKDFPYALPCFAVGVIGASAAILCGLFLKETLKRKSNDGSPTPAPMSTWEIIKFPGVAMVLYLYVHNMLIAFAYTAVIPLFLFTDVRLGGLGFSPLQIALFIGGSGLLQAICVLLVFPPLHKRLGTKVILKACGIVWPFGFALWPLANHLLKLDQKEIFWILVVFNNVIGSGASIAFTAAQLTINDISPSPNTLGTVNGIALTLVSGLRAVAPALFASIFATGARTQVIGGYLVWLVLIVLATLYAVAARYLPAKADGKPKQEPRSD